MSTPGRGRRWSSPASSIEGRMFDMAYYAEVKGIPMAGSAASVLDLAPYWWNVDALRSDPRLGPVENLGYYDFEGVLSLAELLQINDEMIQLLDTRGLPSPHPNALAEMEGVLDVLRDHGDEFQGFLVAAREWESGLG